jgi:hypothetical protein
VFECPRDARLALDAGEHARGLLRGEVEVFADHVFEIRSLVSGTCERDAAEEQKQGAKW